MSRMSARFIAQKIGLTTEAVYEMWSNMGIVRKDNWGDWILTGAGRELGGRLSKGQYPVPTFKFDDIVAAMISFCNKSNGKGE